MIVPTLDTLDVDGKRVLVRADLNVPMADGEITDDFRIKAALPTIEELRSRGAQVIVCSHLGRPKGPDPEFKMNPVAWRLGEVGGFPVAKSDAVVGDTAKAAIGMASTDAVVVLENTRFEPGETTNDPVLAAAFAELADFFVLDAFGSAHRAHASTTGVASRLRSAAGLLLEAEVKALSRLLGEPERPFVVVLGGAKVADKLPVMKSLLPRVDALLVGGGMCFTLLAAEGYEIGESLVDESMIDEVRALLAGPDGGKIMLPVDIEVADRFAADSPHHTVAATAMPDGAIGLDVGPKTVARFGGVIAGGDNVFWNGPMGVFEWDAFRSGTEGVATAMAATEGFTVVGGGDSVAAIRSLGLEDSISHVSTGGGAGLEMLEGTELPGLVALQRWS